MRWASEMSTPWGFPVLEDRLRMAAHFVAADLGLSSGQTFWANSPLPHPRASARSSTSATKERSKSNEKSSTHPPQGNSFQLSRLGLGLKSSCVQIESERRTRQAVHRRKIASPAKPRKSVSLIGQPLMTFVGQAVLLQAAVGFAGNSHFDQTGGQGRFDVAFAEGFTV